jgi:hypothetical protein
VYACTRAQAADVPLDDDAAEDEEADEDDDEDEAVGFESDPVDDDDESDVEPEPDVFAGDEAGALLDEEPRLSFR